MLEQIRELSVLAPLHNPANVVGMSGHGRTSRTSRMWPCSTRPSSTTCRRRRPPTPSTGSSRPNTDPPVRVPRHVPPLRLATGRDRAGPCAGVVQPIVLHLGRRVGGADPRRPSGRDVDGTDAARGPGDGDPVRRHRPRGGVPPESGRRAVDRRDGQRAQPQVRNGRTVRGERFPGPAPADRRRGQQRAVALDVWCTGSASTSVPIRRAGGGGRHHLHRRRR